MTPETKAAIAAVPDDAPATAVIAAWAGDTEVRPWEFWHGNSPESERTLRRWLLDGRLRLHSYMHPNRDYISLLTEFGGDKKEWFGRADTPEAAFQQAVEQFASALREADES